MNWSYIAGFFDGDGCIINNFYTTKEKPKSDRKTPYTYTRLRRRLVFTQSNKQYKVLYAIRDWLERKLNTNIRIYDRGDGSSQLMIIRDADVLAVTKKIFKHLIVKKDKAIALLKTYENKELLK